MSELQMALIACGALLVAGVWAYNLWQERRHRRRAEALLAYREANGPDVLMEGRGDASPARPVRAEPVLGSLDAVSPTATFPEREAKRDDASEVPVTAAGVLTEDWADGRTDCVLHIEFPAAVPAAKIVRMCDAWIDALDKPVQRRGLDANSRRWRKLLPQDAGEVTQLLFALQLVNRDGPVTPATLSAFLEGAHRLARQFGGLIELPAADQVLAQANELDAFCAGVDLQLALHVVPRQGSLNEMLGAKLKPLIAALGLRVAGERYVALDPDGGEAFSLTCRARGAFFPEHPETAALTELLFRLDVPRVASGAAGFERMLACARQCATALGGQLVDAHGNPFAESKLLAIRARIEELQGRMAARDIPAGGARALRLFA